MRTSRFPRDATIAFALLSPSYRIAFMNQTRLWGALALTLVALAPFPALASGRQDAFLELDPAKTQINFTLKGNVHSTEGSFKLKSGEVRVDPATGKADGSVTVDAASATTGIAMRDSKMRDGILEVQRYPEISFAPRHAEGHPVLHGNFMVKIAGVVFLQGGRHELTIEVAIDRTGNDFTAATHFAIPYVKWGLQDPSVLFLKVSDEVDLDVSTEGHVTWVPAR
jgi:polyisoprenoid-binding protein YceI